MPATSANCGPGFDVLGAACNLYNEFTYELTERGFELEVTGEGSGRLHASGKNLAFLAFFRLWNELTDRRYTGLKVTMHNRIPLSRGLGSSSTANCCRLMAANYLTGSTLTRQQLVDLRYRKLKGIRIMWHRRFWRVYGKLYGARQGCFAALCAQKAAELYCRSTGRTAFYRKGKAGDTGNGKP